MPLIQVVENRKKSLGVYVHIPFCRSKCEYCDFYSLPGARNRERMGQYLEAVLTHIREAAPGAAGAECRPPGVCPAPVERRIPQRRAA